MVLRGNQGRSRILAMLRSLVVLFAAVLWFHHSSGENYILPGTFSASGEPLGIDVFGQFDPYGHLGPYCHVFKSMDACEDAMDLVFHLVYRRCNYAPRIASRTFEDISTCRHDVLSILADRFHYLSYLEIGCFQDSVFNHIKPRMQVAVGVDPGSGGTHRMTSDAYFAQNNQSFDLIFVDGDHTAKQAFIDVQNALKVLNPGGTIVMHDCNPRLEQRQVVGAPDAAYNGDVWKVVVYLRSRPDLEIVTIDVDHGVGVIRKRLNLHPLPDELTVRLREHENDPLSAFTFADLAQHREMLLRLVSVQGFRDWLDEESLLPVV